MSGPFGTSTATATGAVGAGVTAGAATGVIATAAEAKGESIFTPLATSSETRLPSSAEKSVRVLLISNLAPLARASSEPSARTLETWRIVPTSSARSWTFLPSAMTGTVVAVFTVTEVGQRMRCSEMDLKSIAGSVAARATGAAGAAATGAAATAVEAGAGAGAGGGVALVATGRTGKAAGA